MMALIRSKWSLYGISGAALFSTDAWTRSSSSVRDLLHRIWRAGDPKLPVTPLLDQWIQDGRYVRRTDLHMLIKQLRKYRRYTHALQVSEWMSNKWTLRPITADVAIRLDLISKVHGLDQAEKYFSSVPYAERDFKLCGALLNCYAEHNSLEKAEATMREIKDFDFMDKKLSYNIMLKLYAQMNKHEKADNLMQEMVEKGICDSYTYKIRLHAYVTSKDIEGMEKLLMQIATDPLLTSDWCVYAIAANGYLKAGQFEKTFAMLKRLEQVIKGNTRRAAFESLLTLYAAIGNKDEMYRIWNRYKILEGSHNLGYFSMLRSLVKLDDIDGAERIIEEWESENTCLDIRIPNLMIIAYCKKGLLEKAQAFISRAFKSGMNPDGNTWGCLAVGYCKKNHLEKAVEMMKRAMLADKPALRPDRYTLSACIEYLKGKGNLESAVEILKLYRDRGFLSEGACDRLFNYVHSENPDTKALDVIKGDYELGKKMIDLQMKEDGEMEVMEEVASN